MARQPTLVRDKAGNKKIAGYFESGRYQFTLSADAERLLTEDLGYLIGDPVPLELFRTLVYAGDAWLPGHPEEPVEAGEDLVEPPAPDRMTDEEARGLADLLRGRRVGTKQRLALKDQIDRTPLGQHLTMASLRRTDEWVKHLPATTEGDAGDNEPPRDVASTRITPSASDTADAGNTADASNSADASDSTAASDSADTSNSADASDSTDAGRATDETASRAEDASGEPERGSSVVGPTTVETASASYLAELEDADEPPFESFPTDRLADAYTLFSVLESRVADLRKAARDELTDRIEDDRQVSGRVGTVEGRTQTRRSLKDEDEVLDAVERHGFPRQTVLGLQVDKDEVEELVEKAGIEESAFYEITEKMYVRRVDFDVSQVERLTAEGAGVPEADAGAPDAEPGESDGVPCPVEECSYRGEPASVAAHVSGTRDEAHDWDELPYSGRQDLIADL